MLSLLEVSFERKKKPDVRSKFLAQVYGVHQSVCSSSLFRLAVLASWWSERDIDNVTIHFLAQIGRRRGGGVIHTDKVAN